MRWCTNVLPGGTTDEAYERWPRRDSSSRLGAAFLWPHASRVFCSAWSFSTGRDTVPATESIWMPKKVMVVDAVTVLWSATGKPRLPHVSIAVARCRLVVSVPGGPTSRKSSR